VSSERVRRHGWVIPSLVCLLATTLAVSRNCLICSLLRFGSSDEKDPGEFWGGGTSFPSGHSIQVWAIASLLAHEYKHQKIVGVTAYSLAGIVSASRIAAQKHFAADIFAGGTMGWFIGRYVYDTHMSHLAHKHAWLTPMIVPEIQPSQRSYGVALVFGGAAPTPSIGPMTTSSGITTFSRFPSR